MATIKDIAGLIERFATAEGFQQSAIGGLRFSRSSEPGLPMRGVQEPALCLVAQGVKRVLLGDEIFEYHASSLIVASVDLPVSGQVIQATPQVPYLGLLMRLDPREVADAALQARLAPPEEAATVRGLFVSEAPGTLLEAIARLIRLLEQPADIPALAPLIQREILYRLLRSEHGWRVAQMTSAHGHAQRVREAINLLRAKFTEPLQIEAFARQVHMSPSSLHHHFKAVTAMSPLQYQKQLRLQEARRLLLAEGLDAATAGHRVGYESASQFSREYSRFFGAPPARDLKRLRDSPQFASAPA